MDADSPRKGRGRVYEFLPCLCFVTEKEREVWALDVDLFVCACLL